MNGEWSRYWRAPDLPLEAMHAHFEGHVYHRHSHETYSFGVTDTGRQAFHCRGGSWVGVPGTVMAFNPDDPHDGRAADDGGFTYRMVHVGLPLPSREAPLFAEPVVRDAALAQDVRDLHRALTAPGATALRRGELLDRTLAALVARASTRPREPGPPPAAGRRAVERATELLREEYLGEIGAADLAEAAGCSRYALYRAFKAGHGLSPSDYQRQLRLRSARRLIAAGHPPAEAAAASGFHDQSHLNRWFRRAYGVTPGAYRASVGTREMVTG